MDPITQGALGAVASQSARRRHTLLPLTAMAALAGMSPDLDVLIRSNTDPLLFLEYHRHFSHSLAFIPLGALLCCLVLHPLLGVRAHATRWQSYWVCLFGYATHALIDGCTTYGTLLLWPFSNERFAWGSIGIVDLFYTVPILIGIYYSIKLRSSWPARLLMIWVFVYPTIGWYQHHKAEQVAQLYLSNALTHAPRQLANSVTQTPPPADSVVRISAKPTVMNLVLWKIVIETNDRYYVDAVRVGVFESPKDALYSLGNSIEKLNVSRDLPWLDPNSQQAKDIQRFSDFSMGYVALDEGTHINVEDFKKPEEALPLRIMDVRYSLLPNEIKPIWSIGLDPNAPSDQHVTYDGHRDASSEVRKAFWSLLFPSAR
ncbi:MAG: metal-dependent hydrolase [Pseudomonadota bacterium]